MKNVRINWLSISIPDTWNQLTYMQSCELVRLLRGDYSLPQIKILFTLHLLDLKVARKTYNIHGEECFTFKHGTETMYISPAQLLTIANTMEWLFASSTDDEGNTSYYPDSKLTANLLPSIKVGGKTFKGPADGLTDMIFDEYINTETNYMRYIHTRNEQYLDNLIAIMYRPMHEGNRVPFHADATERIASNMQRLQVWDREIILLYYIGCRDFLARRFPYVFKTGPEQTRKQTNTYMDMMNLVTQIAQHDPTKHETVRQTLLYDIMVALNNLNKAQT